MPTARHFRIAAMMACLAAASIAHAGPDDDRSYRAGLGLLNKGLHDLAAGEFRAYLREHPEGPDATAARYSLAVCLFRAGKPTEAAREIEAVRTVTDFEFAADALLLWAQCAATTGDEAGAIDALTALAKRYPNFAQLDRTTALRGELLFRTGRFEEARTELAQVGQRWPTSAAAPRAELLAAMAQAALHDDAGAADRAGRLYARDAAGEYAAHAALLVAQCRHRLGDGSAAIAAYQHASVAGSPVRCEALLGLAAVAREQGDAPRAEQALAEAEKAKPSGELLDRLRLERARFRLQAGDAAGAVEMLKKVGESASPAIRAEAALWLGRCASARGKYAEAAAWLEQSASRYADHALAAEMLFDRAVALALQGDDRAALRAWEEWEARFPKHALRSDALLAHAWCALRLGDHATSSSLCRAVAETVGSGSPSESLGLLTAETAFAAEQFQTALAAYERFLERFPHSTHLTRANFRRVICLVRLDRRDDAASLLRSLPTGDQTDVALHIAAIGALADSYFDKADWEHAEPWFAAMADAPASPEAGKESRLRQAICALRRGRTADAVGLLEPLAASADRSATVRHARFELGQALLELGRTEDARAALEPLVADDEAGPLAVPARRHLAAIASRQGRHDDAASWLAQVASQDESSAGAAQLDLAQALLAAGKYPEAERALDDCLASKPAPPQRDRAAALRAIAINRQGRHGDALPELERAVRATTLDAETRASSAYEAALALRHTGRTEEAAVMLRALQSDAPARLRAYAALDLAQWESAADRHEAALALVETALAAGDTLPAPDSAAVRERGTALRGSCLLRLGQPREAIQSLAPFAQQYPQSPLLPIVRLTLGEALQDVGDATGAAEQFSLAADSPTPEIGRSALLRLGQARAVAAQWTLSEQAYTAFLDQHPDSDHWFQARFGQGWARENQGRHEAAIEAYRDVVSRHQGPTAARAQFQIGECLYAQRKHEQAIAELLKTDVLFAYPEWSAAALYEAGRCLNELNRPADAARQFDDLIRRFPDTRWAAQAIAQRKSAPPSPAPVPGRAGADTRSQPASPPR